MGKDVIIQAVCAEASARAPAENIQHRCPICKEAMDWPAFQTHAEACIAAHPEKVREIQEKGE